MTKGPDFSKTTAETLAKRAAQLCSRPSCRKTTSGPHSEESKAINLGEAAHIKGARLGAKRYDLSMTDEERSQISNGIWLCRLCAKEIDTDEKKFPVDAVRTWKEEHERFVVLQGPQVYSNIQTGEELHRVQRENAELRRENEELRQTLKSKEDFESRYELVAAPSRDTIYVSRENSAPFKIGQK